MMERVLDEKLSRLQGILEEMGSVLVAFSGGVDSTFLLKVAYEVLGDNAVGVTAVSESVPRREIEEAKQLASWIGVPHLIIRTEELKNPAYRENPENRCYYCKDELFGRLRPLAKELKRSYIVDGTNLDDLGDHRPGRLAAQEHGVRSPLVEADLGKREIRLLSQRLGLPTHDKPSSPCLSSRLPYGARITKEKLQRVEAAEEILRGFGFRQVRVRHHETLARIELPREELSHLLEEGLAEQVASRLKALGYLYVTVDVEGYRPGSLRAPNKTSLGEVEWEPRR